MSRPVGIFVKSFAPDFDRLAQLVDSIEQYLQDATMPFVVSVPAAEATALVDRIGLDRATIVHDEAYACGRSGLTGWEQQQVCKLSVWRLGIADAWFSIDSDSYFVRPFGPGDFVAANGGARLVMSHLRAIYRSENEPLARLMRGQGGPPAPAPPASSIRAAENGPDLSAELTRALADRWAHPHTKRARLNRIFPRPGGYFHAMPGAILDTRLLADMDARLIRAHGLAARDLIVICPFEYDWQLEWAIATGYAFEPVEPLIFHIDSEAGLADLSSAGIGEADIAKHFLGIAMASRHLDRVRL